MNQRCDYLPTGAQRSDGACEYRCRRPACGHTRWSTYAPAALRRRCQAPAEQANRLLTRTARYVAAVARWRLAGCPTRSDQRVAEIYEQICRRCEHFSQDRCQLCGCPVHSGSLALRNKLRMATERCPAGKWGDGDSA